MEHVSAIDAAALSASGRDQKLQREGAGFNLAAEYERETAPRGRERRKGLIREGGA